MASRYSISLALGVVQADAEHVGVGELVHPLVELAEDGLEVERGGDLAADVAQQLDVASCPRSRSGRGPRRPRRAAAPRRTARARAPCRPAAGAGSDRRRRPASPSSSDVAGVGPPGAIPRRQDGERVGGLAADLAGDIARPDVEAIVAEAQVGEVASRLAASSPTSRRRGRRAWSGTRSPSRRRTSAPRTRSAAPTSRRATGRRPGAGAAEQRLILVGRHAAHQRRKRRRRCAALRAISKRTNVCPEAEPHHAVGLREHDARWDRGRSG